MASNRFIYYILTAFITGNLLLIFLQYNAVKNINKLIEGNEQVLNEFTVETGLRDIRKNMLAVETGIARTLSSGDSSPVANLQQEVAAAEGNLDKLQKINDNDSTVKYVDQLDELVHKKIHLDNEVLQVFYRKGKEAADTLLKNGQEKELADSISFVSHQLERSRRHLLADITASIDKNGLNARRWGIVLFIMVSVSGATLFWFIINRVRRQNQLILQLDASKKKVKETAQIKENFVANMSHEIRTPLNAIIGFTGLLQKKNLDADANRYVQSIQQSGNNLLNIVNDVLDLSKFEAGMMRIESFPFSIRELMHSVATMFYEKAKEKNLALTVVIDDVIPETLEGDATRLTQILVNLMGNAVKFTDTGSIKVTAAQDGISQDTIRLCFTITDTGIGIEKDKLPGIFERFGQAEASITRKYGGTGLGLYIVKDLVQLQNGELNVESQPGRGSRFRFTIPYGIARKAPPPQAVEKRLALTSVFADGHILVVEDNEMNQLLMKHFLGQWQLSYTIADSGLKAIDLLKNQLFDLVLMDIQMPGMDGYTAARIIRQDLKLTTPVIAMTAHVLAGEKEKCLGFGMNDYLSKPIHEASLLALIKQYIPSCKETMPEKEHADNNHVNRYSTIDLQYMQGISNGDKEYEKAVTGIFLTEIPGNLNALEKAFSENDSASLQQLAHNMKTTVSVMGLSASLQPLLDALEYHSPDVKKDEILQQIRGICQAALEEAATFYATL